MNMERHIVSLKKKHTEESNMIPWIIKLKFNVCIFTHTYVYDAQEKKSVTSKKSRGVELEIHDKKDF